MEHARSCPCAGGLLCMVIQLLWLGTHTPLPRSNELMKRGAIRFVIYPLVFHRSRGIKASLAGRYGSIRQIRIGNKQKTKGTIFVVFDDVMDAKNTLHHLNIFHLQERTCCTVPHAVQIRRGRREGGTRKEGGVARGAQEKT
ncbi:hypothetical protein DICSQDRAFT_157662 [Dichomitus squalens LYAD-421 SS1]|uniref:RRM domain-containing protein n=2 Tax=Dichomitus squalens TaxID=114155 RepID=R7SLW7_DICSQ|nr:uncharacterized protein DICSQDRAFT_157662 [Dichomitus squalens LYAD-421 SS1]EJF56868.1 hypothetical protein DICSQDRAFT_157662 [Dichomitus squalens LYAD-421 SS1]